MGVPVRVRQGAPPCASVHSVKWTDMEQVLRFVTLSTASLYGVAALVIVGFALYWLVGKSARERQLAYLRKRLDDLEPADPEYNQVRALYTSMAIDAHRWNFYHSSNGGDRNSDQDGGSHSTADHSAGSGGAHSD